MTRRGASPVVGAIALGVAAIAVGGCAEIDGWAKAATGNTCDPGATACGPAAPETADLGKRAALRLVDQLAVRNIERPAAAGEYRSAREPYGQRWSDDVTVRGGHNGCDTRNDVLRGALSDVRVKEGTHGCKVLAGTLDDPYTGQTVRFRYGHGSLVDVDHRVTKEDGWYSGAYRMSADKRRDFANDPDNLAAVAARVNRQKSGRSAADWLPPLNRCRYVIAQATVKDRYGLTVTKRERDTMRRVVANYCA